MVVQLSVYHTPGIVLSVYLRVQSEWLNQIITPKGHKLACRGLLCPSTEQDGGNAHTQNIYGVWSEWHQLLGWPYGNVWSGVQKLTRNREDFISMCLGGDMVEALF